MIPRMISLLMGCILLCTPFLCAQGSPLVSVDESPSWLVLDENFVSHRVQLHTRLWNYENWQDPKDVFNMAESYFDDMGVKVYTRHCKTGDEGAWWPSSVGYVEPVTAGADLAQQMIDRAHSYDMDIILYHRHMEDAYMAAQNPDWVCKDENGQPAEARRGLYHCLNSPYLDYFTIRMLELLNRGADGFYFDEQHMPDEGCWCSYCQAKFTAETGLQPPAAISYSDPIYNRYLQFKNETIEAGFEHYIQQAYAIKPGLPMLISTPRVTWLNDPRMRSNLVRIAPSPKDEYPSTINKWGTNVFFKNYTTTIPLPLWDVQQGFGMSYLRDAAQGRPPHIWIPDLRSEEETLSVSGACLTYGLIANLDVSEGKLPDPMFENALELGEKVSPYLARTRPVRWAAIHFSERARNLYLTNLEQMYQKLLVPCWQSFRTLNRLRAPIGVVTDQQLENNELTGYELLILPIPGILTVQEQANVDAFEQAGGTVIYLADDPRWYTQGQQSQIRAELLNSILTQAGDPPVSMTGGPDAAHAVAVMRPDDPSRVVVCIKNDATWIGMLQAHRLDGNYETSDPGILPPPVTGAQLFVKGPVPTAAFDAVKEKALAVIPSGNGVYITVPQFQHLACVVLDYERTNWDYFLDYAADLFANWLENQRQWFGLTGSWTFDEGGGSDAEDSSEYQNHGQLVNMNPMDAWVPGHDGTWALDFDGVNDYVVIPDSTSGLYDFNGQGLTWSAWIQTSKNAGITPIIAKSPVGFANDQGAKTFGIDYGRLTLRGNYSGYGGESTGKVNDGQWHHVAMTIEFDTFPTGEDTLKFYIDSIEDGGSTERNINERSDQGYRLTIGDGPWGIFDGKIDDVRIYNYAMSQSQIQDLYAGNPVSSESNYFCPEFPVKDLNEDCKVDFSDYQQLADDWFSEPGL